MLYRPKIKPVEAVCVEPNFIVPDWMGSLFVKTTGSNVVAGVIENRVVFFGDYLVNDGEQIGVMTKDEFELNFEPIGIE